MYLLRNIEARTCNHFCSGKVISITYSGCVFLSLGIHHAICAISVTCQVIKTFSPHYLIKGTNFEKKSIVEHKMCVVIFSKTCLKTILFLRKIERRMIINVHRSSCKVPVIVVRF
jgi:hypothetical protein